LANFDPKIAKLVEFQIGEISKIFSISLWKNGKFSPQNP
jgi:hypothetical protein